MLPCNQETDSHSLSQRKSEKGPGEASTGRRSQAGGGGGAAGNSMKRKDVVQPDHKRGKESRITA